MTITALEFDVDKHRDFIRRRGERITWLRSSVCPCSDPLSGSRNRTCELCSGTGYIYTRAPEIVQDANNPHGLGEWSAGGGFVDGASATSIGMRAKLRVLTAIVATGGRFTVTVTGIGCATNGTQTATVWTLSAENELPTGTYDFAEQTRILDVTDITVQPDPGAEVSAGALVVEGLRIDDEYRALVRQVDERKEYTAAGQIYIGDITITTMPDELPIGEGDIIGLPGRRFKREEIIPASGGPTDKLHWTPAARLIDVRTITRGYLIGDEVMLTADALQWLNPPQAGTHVSVVYEWIPQYIVLPSMISTRRTAGGMQMPQRVVARLKGREEFRC